jgi:hypothetical protein
MIFQKSLISCFLRFKNIDYLQSRALRYPLKMTQLYSIIKTKAAPSGPALRNHTFTVCVYYTLYSHIYIYTHKYVKV